MVGDRNNQLTLVDRVRREGDRLVLPAGFRSAVTDYLLIETPVALVLVPESGDKVPPRGGVDEEGERTDISPPDRDELLRNAFARLRSRIGASAWALSETPYRDLLAGFRDLASQPAVAEDVAVALRSLPAVRSSVEMLFTTVAMSARAQWRDAPPEIRTILARGWFLGRWLPTFLVVDGPIRRFLNSQAFGRQAPPVPMLKHVRRFLAEPIFMALRHAFVHWSFAWATSGDDSEIIAYDGDAQEAEHRLTREEADAFHVITFAAVQTLFDTFMRSSAPAVEVAKDDRNEVASTDADAVPHAFDPIWKYIEEAHARACRCEAAWRALEESAGRHQQLSARMRAGDQDVHAELIQVQTAIVDATEVFLFQSGLLSLLLYAPSKRPAVVERCRRARRLLGLAEGAVPALESRALRDAFAHMDERIDTAVATHQDLFVRNYFEAERNSSVPLKRCLRAFDTLNLCVWILGTPHDVRAIAAAVARVREGLDEARTTLERAQAMLA